MGSDTYSIHFKFYSSALGRTRHGSQDSILAKQEDSRFVTQAPMTQRGD